MKLLNVDQTEMSVSAAIDGMGRDKIGSEHYTHAALAGAALGLSA
jgi:hypothetical protein